MKLIDIDIQKIILSSGFLFALSYFLGSLYLKFYFDRFSSIIPFHEIPAFEIVLLGSIPTFAIIIILFLGHHLINKFFKTNLVVYFVFIILILLSSIIFLFKSASYIAIKFLPYSYIFSFNKELPVITAVYNTPLNYLKFDGNKMVNEIDSKEKKFIGKTFSGEIVGASTGNLKYENTDVIYSVSQEKTLFIGNFILLFENGDNYYLIPLDFNQPMGGVIIHLEDLKKQQYVSEAFLKLKAYSLITIPKRNIEFIKYITARPSKSESYEKYVK